MILIYALAVPVGIVAGLISVAVEKAKNRSKR